MDRRAGELMEEYRGEADKVDRLLGEVEEGRGRMRRRLDQFGELIGLVSGLFNEASSDILMLLDAMATSRESGLTSGQQEVEKGRVQGELRVQISLSSMRAGMACMLDRCHQIGDTAGLCSRREVTWKTEVAMRRQREAQHLARVRGHHLLRRGHIMV